MNYSIIYYKYYVLGGLQFELNSKQFGKTMIQAIPSNSIFHNKFTAKMAHECHKTFKFEFQFEFPYPGVHLGFRSKRINIFLAYALQVFRQFTQSVRSKKACKVRVATNGN